MLFNTPCEVMNATIDVYKRQDGGYPLHRVEEVAGGGQRVSHRQMPVVVGVLVVPLDHEAVVGKLQSLFEYPLAHHLYRKTCLLYTSRCV